MNHKLEKMTKRKNRPLRDNDGAIKTLDNLKLPFFVNDLFSNGPKHPVKDKFIEIYFLADIDKLVNNLRQNGANGKKLCENEATAKSYAKIKVMGFA